MIANYSPGCALCRFVNDGEVLTEILFENDLLSVTYCVICSVPMAVLKGHRSSFSRSEKSHVRRLFRELLRSNPLPLERKFEKRLKARKIEFDLSNPREIAWVIDWEQRKIPDHAHCHLRPFEFEGTNQWEKLYPGDW